MNYDHKEIIEACEKAQKAISEKTKINLGTEENPYFLYVSQILYDKLKEYNLINDDDMYFTYCGWTKVIVVTLRRKRNK